MIRIVSDDSDRPPRKTAHVVRTDRKPIDHRSGSGAGSPASMEERWLRFDDLASFKGQLDREQLLAMIGDGRAMVRANAALGLAAIEHASLHLVNLLRDSDASVATAATEAIARLGERMQPFIGRITQALDGTRPEVTDRVLAFFADLVGVADDELVRALDVPLDLAMRTIVEVAARVHSRGVALLIRAAGHEHSRIRINAVAGLARVGSADSRAAMALLTRLEATDPVPDVRSAARKAMLAVVAQPEVEATYGLSTSIPEFEDRKLAAAELREYIDAIDIDEMINALRDGRNHVRINAARSLAVKGAEAGRAARAVGLLLRDGIPSVRREAARALGRLGDGAADAADDLVGALGDSNQEVADAAADTLAALAAPVMDALTRGLETGDEAHGRRVVELLGRLPGAAEVLTRAFASPAVNVQVNAAIGLGLLGRDRIGPGLRALTGAITRGDARTRDAVRRALDLLGALGAAGPAPVEVDGFDHRFLAPEELGQTGASIDDLCAYLQDGRDAVRANAATALGLAGEPALAAARSIGVVLRDDAARVRLAAARALDRLGDDAVDQTADGLCAALADGDPEVASACAAILRARGHRVAPALVRALETDRPEHGRRIVEIIGALDDASEILCDAFLSPAVNVQVNAALGLGMLGPARVGHGRRVLEGARTGGWKRTREAVFAALEALDDRGRAGAGTVEVDGFESRLLAPEDLAAARGALAAEDLIAHLQDGRAVVRANAATALGVLGLTSREVVRPLAVLLRDDDMRVRIRAAGALHQLGDAAVRDTADYLVGALSGDREVADACAEVLRPRGGRVLTALVRGLDTSSEVHARRILDLIVVQEDAGETLCDAFESPIENVQVNAATGLGMIGSAGAGSRGRRLLEGARTRGTARTREAVFKALALLDRS